MPDEQGHPLPGEDGYVAYQESLQNQPGTPETIDNPPVQYESPATLEEKQEYDEQLRGQEPGPPADPPNGVTEEDFEPNTDTEVHVPNVMEEHAEQTVDKAGRPAGFNQFYHGDHVVHPENPLLEFMPSDLYDTNKNRENR